MLAHRALMTLSLAGAFLLLGGCATKAPVSGFAPVYPKQTFSLMHLRSNMADVLDWAKVDSLQPTFRWEPFPGTDQRGWGTPTKPFVVVEDAKSVSDVTYELKIWIVSNGAPGEVVYEREGLTEPSHRIESPLKPETEYYWSVRARFKLEGKPRVTEWSLTTAHGVERGAVRQSGVIPPVSYYRFETPPASRLPGGK